jgi:hypothetical protein
MTWREVLAQTVLGYQAFSDAHPDLVDSDINPGSRVDLTVDAGDIGAVTVTVQIPAPLAPPAGQLAVAIHDPVGVIVNVPQDPQP